MLGHAQPEPRHRHGRRGPRRGDAVGPRHAGVVRDPAEVVDDQQRALLACEDRLDLTPDHVELLAVERAEPGLGDPHRALHQHPDGGVQRERRSAQVDDADELARARVVHRPGRAVPGVLLVLVVLGGEQLDRRGLCERRPDRVGADGRLRPRRTLGEAERVGLPAYAGRPLAPQHAAVGVGDDHEEGRRVRYRGQHVPQLVDDERDRGLPPPALDLAPRHRVAYGGPVGVEALRHHAAPRPQHHVPRRGAARRATAGQHDVVQAPQLGGACGQVHAGPDRRVPRCRLAHPCPLTTDSPRIDPVRDVHHRRPIRSARAIRRPADRAIRCNPVRATSARL